jgi:hypothetical protein
MGEAWWSSHRGQHERERLGGPLPLVVGGAQEAQGPRLWQGELPG